MEHRTIPVGQNHTPYQWIVADEAARSAIIPTADDRHKLCLQLNDGTGWRLAGTDPPVWESTAAISADPLAYYILAKS